MQATFYPSFRMGISEKPKNCVCIAFKSQILYYVWNIAISRNMNSDNQRIDGKTDRNWRKKALKKKMKKITGKELLVFPSDAFYSSFLHLQMKRKLQLHRLNKMSEDWRHVQSYEENFNKAVHVVIAIGCIGSCYYYQLLYSGSNALDGD